MQAIPSLVLWAWERPEDLRFINPDDTGIAFLADTVVFRGDRTEVRPRRQPLLVPDRAKLVAVVRVEAGADGALNSAQIERSVAAIMGAASLPRVAAVQVDFDATRSQRAFYRELLARLRNRLPANMPISITALGSWCMEDDWISGVPVDEAVPMLFRMGMGKNEVVSWVTSGRDFRSQLCRDSLGVSTDERWSALPGGKRLYVFNPRPWTAQSQLALLWETHSWR